MWSSVLNFDIIIVGLFFFFFIWVFFHNHPRITGLQGREEGISLIPHYHFHPLHRHLDFSRVIIAESSPLYTYVWNRKWRHNSNITFVKKKSNECKVLLKLRAPNFIIFWWHFTGKLKIPFSVSISLVIIRNFLFICMLSLKFLYHTACLHERG